MRAIFIEELDWLVEMGYHVPSDADMQFLPALCAQYYETRQQRATACRHLHEHYGCVMPPTPGNPYESARKSSPRYTSLVREDTSDTLSIHKDLQQCPRAFDDTLDTMAREYAYARAHEHGRTTRSLQQLEHRIDMDLFQRASGLEPPRETMDVRPVMDALAQMHVCKGCRVIVSAAALAGLKCHVCGQYG
jgi:hypothetical protein